MQANKRIFALLGILILCVSVMANAQEGEKEVVLENVTGEIYQLLNVPGGNVIALLGEEGVLVVDSGTNPPDGPNIESAIKEKGSATIKYLVLTHWHGDHVGGNEYLAGKGTIIVAHKNLANTLKSEVDMKFFGRKREPSPKGAWPTLTFAEKVTLHLNGEIINVFHIKPGHTDGDGIVLFKNANLIHLGDLFFNGLYPYIGVSSGGSVTGMIDVLTEVLSMIDDNTIVVPGHGPRTDKAGLKTYVEMLRTIRDRVKPMIDAGKSLEDVQAAKPTAEFDDAWGKLWMDGDEFVRLLYMDMTGTG